VVGEDVCDRKEGGGELGMDDDESRGVAVSMGAVVVLVEWCSSSLGDTL
jgi:hypothetical protein